MRTPKKQKGFLDGILGSIAGPFISGVLGMAGQEDTNESNQEIARNATAFNAAEAAATRQWGTDEADRARQFNRGEAATARDFAMMEAEKNRSFQERLANSAYQRAIGDMKAAGLNPMLAYSKGGAITPPGATAGTSQAQASGIPGGATAQAVTARMENPTAAGLNSAAQAAQVQQTRAQTDNIEQNTLVQVQDVITKAAQAGHLDALKDNIRQEMKSFSQRMQNLRVKEQLDISQRDKNVTEHLYRSRQAEAGQIEADVAETQANAKRLVNFATLLGLEIPAAVNAAAHQKKYPGYNIDVKPFVDDSGKIINSAGKLFDVFRGKGFSLKGGRK